MDNLWYSYKEKEKAQYEEYHAKSDYKMLTPNSSSDLHISFLYVCWIDFFFSCKLVYYGLDLL